MPFRETNGLSPAVISLVSIFAILNGALVQIIMATRILYGLTKQGLLPAAIGRVHPATRTPLMATALITVLVLLLALWFPVERLAAATSTVALIIFTVVNLALFCIKLREPAPPGLFRVPLWVPVVGFLASLGLLAVTGLGFFTV